jgi:hypothetical protein
MNTQQWGKPFWFFLDGLSCKYTLKKKRTYEAFFDLLRDMLPCIYCRISYAQFIQEAPITKYLYEEDGCVKWIYDIHEKVNDKLRKQGYKSGNKKKLTTFKRELQCFNESDKRFIDSFWLVLFTTAFIYESHKKTKYINFLKLLSDILPNGKLKTCFNKSLCKNINYMKKCLKSQYTYIKLIYKIYSDICPEIKHRTTNFKTVYTYYNNMRAGCGKVGNKGPSCRLPFKTKKNM